jgi:hypothetical protein
MAAERNLAKEKVELEATKRALDVVQRELEKFNRKISQRKKSSGAIHTTIPGIEETIAPRDFVIDRRTYAIRSIEEVCAAYGLGLVPTFDLPDMPVGRPYWRPEWGKVFTSICPTCGELLWVNSHYQRWTCLRCDRRFPKTEGSCARRNRSRRASDRLFLLQRTEVGDRDRCPASTERVTAG